ncbi:MAG: type II secretion system F family protein [Acidimicrobiales bacterium]|nr:type II secretion system F family protein [Acidimicrobiales bacterium]
MELTVIIAILVATAGAVAVAAGAYDRLVGNNAAAMYLASMEEPGDVEDEFTRQLALPFLQRATLNIRGSVLPLLQRVTPTGWLDKARHNITMAGMSETLAPEELVTGQVVLGMIGFLLGILAVTMGGLTGGQSVLAMVLLPGVGALLPSVIVKRKATERSEAIFKDLPDSLDLLAISVEAGVGFEAALDVVCSNFDSPLADEFRRTLQEMELGLARKEALQNLKARTNVPALSTFIMALTQADALGMPIGRVLHTQALELRSRRRQWAREKAAKLPVKILFPLVFFIFPAVLVVILGPAYESISGAF